MKTSKGILAALSTLSVISIMSQAVILAQTNAPPPPQDTSSERTTEFHKGEFNISPFGTYVDEAGGKWGAGVAGTYFITDRIGLGAATYWTETGGTFFDNVEFEGYFRLPLKKIAPYGLVSLGYQFNHDYWFEALGVGLDFRAFKRLDAFADFQWRIVNSSASQNGAFLRLGLRFNL